MNRRSVVVVLAALTIVGVTVGVKAAGHPRDFLSACLDDPADLPRSECEALDALSRITHSVRVRPDGDPVCQGAVLCTDGHVTRLQLLDLFGELGPEVGEFTHLTNLFLESHEIGVISPAVGNLTELRSLFIKGGFDAIPPEIGNLAKLDDLAIVRTDANELPDEIGNLVNLRRLALHDNDFDELPATIVNLTNLGKLDVSGFKGDQLGFELAKMTNLEGLRLQGVGPDELGEIDALTNLTSLSLSGGLTEVPAGVTRLSKLRTLRLNQNDITTVPSDIAKLTELRELSLSGNVVTELPPQIGQIPYLQRLSLDRNQLTSLPPEIGDLAELTGLTVGDNPLRALPPEIGNLSSLTHLGAGNPNATLELPSEITKLRTLERFELAKDACITATTDLAEWMESVSGITSGDLCR